MEWLELSVESPPEFVEPLSQIFYRYGHGGVAVESAGGYNPDEGETSAADQTKKITTYLPINESTNERRSQIDIGVRLVAHVSNISPLTERILKEEDWEHAWKEHFHVLHITKTIVIVPTWRNYTPLNSEITILLDPGMAFGTGHHPTTRMCLEQLEDLIATGDSLLDVGCGSAVLSLAAAKLGAKNVFGLEIDPVATNVAKQNVGKNEVQHTVQITQGSLPHQDVLTSHYQIVMANISAKVISEISNYLVESVAPGGKIIASGILLESVTSVLEKFEQSGAIFERQVTDGDWVTLVLSVQ